MAQTAARLLWPRPGCGGLNKPAAWAAFAAAMHIFDTVVVHARDAAVATSSINHLAICAIVSQQEARGPRMALRLCASDAMGADHAQLRRAVTSVLQVVHCRVHPRTLVTSTLASDGDACVAAAAYASASFADPSVSLVQCLERCQDDAHRILSAFEAITGIVAETGLPSEDEGCVVNVGGAP